MGKEREKFKRSEGLLKAIRGFKRVVIVVHDNPDPDAMASAWAIHNLISRRLLLPVKVLGRGVITRAENVRFLSLLKPPIRLVDQLSSENSDTAIVAVDCSPASKNNMVADSDLATVAVIDHHPLPARAVRARHRDIRTSAIATASIATHYLIEQAIEPEKDLATALLYAMRSDARGVENPFSRSDLKIVAWLSDRVDHNKLNQIENAPLTRSYFSDLAYALQNTFVYESIAVCYLPCVSGPEIVGEVADLLIRCDTINRVLCFAAVSGSILLSARTDDTGGEAAELLREAIGDLGYSGGHQQRAGGRIVGVEATLAEQKAVEVRRRWLSACKVDETRGARLVLEKTNGVSP